MHFNHTVHSKHASYQIRRLQIQDSHNDMIRKAINQIVSHVSHVLPIEQKLTNQKSYHNYSATRKITWAHRRTA
jgi:hypothetical protein